MTAIKTIQNAFNDFDVDTLDLFEERMYNNLIKESTKEEALKILINSTEGDYTQLSPDLAALAQEIENI